MPCKPSVSASATARPIGPVRLDLSLSPDSPRFFGFQGTENQLLYGGGQAVVQRINVFQFHFSLGQAF